ncbi:MAG TPA: carboxypeptidase regulatory-like domain-containing protein, partial [Bacteroidia bacterium]|nr:carboxypeptidase regulatory-like domain-containing protein [Bacteroidia bacterium]
NNSDYAKAIPYYLKAIKSKNNNPKALERLADCYRLTNNYQNAETYYSQLITAGNVPQTIDYFNYAIILKSNGEYEKSKQEIIAYLKLNPSDKNAQIQLASFDKIAEWQSEPAMYSIKNISSINSNVSEFSPIIYKNEMVFVSERNPDLVNFQDYGWTNEPYLNIYASEIKQNKDSVSFGTPFLFSKKTTSDGHDGPISFSTAGDEMCFSRVALKGNKDKNFVNRSKIYFSKRNGNSWGKVIPFQYNSDSYSVYDPCISVDGQSLFFASDMPGGFGGTDLYVCKKNGDAWGQPENLGTDVNTSGNEILPFQRADGTLFFASDGQQGLGGLDVFSATYQNDKWTNVDHLGMPLNSSADDFGICFTDNNNGYFSSNRAGGKGSDDIYSFKQINNFINVSGKILLSKNINDPAKNVKVNLLSEKDENILKSTKTDISGSFIFEHLNPDKKYMVKMDDEDATQLGKKQYYLANDKGKIVRVTVVDKAGNKFVFQNLPADTNALMPMDDADSSHTIAGNLLVGENPSAPLTNVKVNLINDKGEIVQSTTTNTFGSFVFSNLPSDQNYMVKVDENDPAINGKKITMTNRNGTEIANTTAGKNGTFNFKILASDKNTLDQMNVKDADLRWDMKGKIVSDNNKALNNLKVNLVDDKGKIIATTTTNASGGFNFKDLPTDKNYMVTMDANDTRIKKAKKIFLTDNTGKIVKVAIVGKDATFSFHLLKDDKSELGTIYVNDPWLKVLKMKNEKKLAKQDSLMIIENIYYDYGKWDILPAAQQTLDKVVQVMKNDPSISIELSSYTDPRGTAEFNQTLSDKRAQTAVDYIIAHGISAKRISGKGYGETKLLNDCGTHPCTEEQYAINRRTEFKVIRK